jgi:hypothetical protein
MWQSRGELFSKSLSALELLEPALAARYLDVRYEVHPGLGRFGDRGVQYEVAGFVDRPGRRIAISQQFPVEVMRFTGAHEVGHWLLHPRQIVHRDRPIKGLDTVRLKRPPEEQEADFFSACFLTPRKLVTEAFAKRFGAAPLTIDDAAAFWLSPDDPEKVLRPDTGSFDCALALATARSYAGKHFQSLAKEFRISTTTMAIRLNELALIYN